MALTLILAGCASSGGAAGGPAQQTVRIVGPSGAASSITLTSTDDSHHKTLPYSADQVFRLIPNVLDSLGVQVTMLEPSKRVIGNPALKVRQRLKTTPLSRYIDCGTSTQVGENADNYDVSLSVIVEVRPGAANSAQVSLEMEAAARPMNFAQEYTQCRSRGRFESRFFEILNGRLAETTKGE